MAFVIREKDAERYIACVMADGKVPHTEKLAEAIMFPSQSMAQKMADDFSLERKRPGMYVVVDKDTREETENLFMIRENSSMTYVAVIGPDSVGTTKDGQKAIHYRDEVIAKEQARILGADASTRTYTVIISQTSVGIK